MATLDPEYLHEPRMGLEAGADGLDFVRRILVGAASHLRPGGVLVCEVGASQEALEQAFPAVAFTWLDLSRGGEGVFLLEAARLGRFDPLKLDQLVDELEVDEFLERPHGRGREPS